MSLSKTYDPELHLANYNNLIGDEKSFSYAVLELRFAVEAIVYRQIKSYNSGIPEQIITTWQPNKSFKLLCNFDEKADQSIDIAWAAGGASEDPKKLDFKNLGSQRVFTVPQLNKMYNTLGNFLHLPSVKSANTFTHEKNVKTVTKIYEKLRDIVTNGSLHIKTSLLEGTCPYCRNSTFLPTSILNEKSTKHYRCTAQNCNKTFLGFSLDGALQLEKAGIEVQCPSCKHSTFIENTVINSVHSAIELDVQCCGEGCDKRITFRPFSK